MEVLHRIGGVRMALLAAVLFGASTPLAKGLLLDTSPRLLAGLLYLGSGAGLLLVRLVQRGRASREAALSGRSCPGLPERSPQVACSPLAVAGAGLCWAVDNNLTQRVSAGDPVQIADQRARGRDGKHRASTLIGRSAT